MTLPGIAKRIFVGWPHLWPHLFLRVAAGASCVFYATSGAVQAQGTTELSFYSGPQIAPDSTVQGNDPGGVGSFDFLSTWDGRSFEAPLHYGLRATRWTGPNLGFGIDFNHTKVHASDDTLVANGFDRLEFTDGLNIVTANVWYRWHSADRDFTPYVGAGAGLAIPHVDVETPGGTTFDYQVTGPAVQVVAGIKYNFNANWGVFGEYKGTYSMNEAELSNGGTLSTDIMTNAINVGVSFSF